MAPSSCSAYKYVLTPQGHKILPVDESSCKDEESPAEYNTGGYCPVKLNDTFKLGRYRVLRKLGWGHFSTVWLVKDTESVTASLPAFRPAFISPVSVRLNRHSALKVVKSAGRYAETARDEIKLLSQGPEASHICIVFEPLGEHLLALIERNKRKGVPRALVKVIAKQVLLGLEYLHDECDLVHTDIKPENILISIPDVEPTSTMNSRIPRRPPPGAWVSHLRQITFTAPGPIFDSQPLSSPGSRSVAVAFSVAPADLTVSVEAMCLPYKCPYGKIRRGLSASAPRTVVPSSKSNPVTAASSHANSPTSPPSTSSSTSSFSSSVSNPFTGAGSVGTPPTSLSNSLGGHGRHRACYRGEQENNPRPLPIPHQPQERVGLPMKERSRQSSRSLLRRPGKKARVFKRDAHFSVTEIYQLLKRQIQDPPRTHQIEFRHFRVQFMEGSWPVCPAPALVVSAVVSAGGDQQGDISTLRARAAASRRVGVYHRIVGEFDRDCDPGTAVAEWYASGAKKSSGFKIDSAAGSPEPEPEPEASTSWTLNRPAANSVGWHLGQASPARLGAASYTIRARGPPFPASSSSSHNNNPRTTPMSPSSAASLTPTAASPPPSASPAHSYALTTTPTPAHSPAHAPAPLPPAPPLIHTHTPALALPKPRPSCAPGISIKIADLGNATPSKKHYTEDIQTRQYRSPEAIIGRRDWGTRADIWSVACLVFELLTAEFLFDPQGQGDLFSKDDDHMAQIIELLGDFSLDVKKGGKYSADLFDANGGLRYIKTLKPWPLKRVMTEKYLWSEPDATVLCTFLEPMLAVDQRKRTDAKDILGHPWLEVTAADDVVGEW
ncbi:kinase-like domain-containing protein [Mycena galopus ATCC 62051]|nr:kinase-like domain-containing protein [Mycena galopus ATCC 62051]